MSSHTTTVSTQDLSLGMYVARLDRPWLETPFLFQGFYIENDDQIRELQEYCEHVEIDADRHDPSLSEDPATGYAVTHARSLTTSKRRLGFRGLRRLSRRLGDAFSRKPVDFNDTRAMRKEMGQARVAHQATVDAMRNAYSAISSGSPVKMDEVQDSLDPMIDSIVRNDDAMSWLARMQSASDYVYDHSIGSSVWAVLFGKHLGMGKDDLMTLGVGAMFMDVGKTRLPREILESNEPLTEEQLETARSHVTHGVEIVQGIGLDAKAMDMVRDHHERHNGTGYPRRLSGNDIPVFARIAGIVDAYDAMTSPRPYAEVMSAYDAMRELNKLAGVEFQAEMVERFVQSLGVFPVGALVELSTGEVGVVISQNRIRRLRPRVMLLLDRDTQALGKCVEIDLRTQLVDPATQTTLSIARGLAPGAFGIDPGEFFLPELESSDG